MQSFTIEFVSIMIEDKKEKDSFYRLRGYLTCLREGEKMALLQLRSYWSHFGLITLIMSILAAFVGGGQKLVSVPAFYEPIPVYPVWKLIIYSIAIVALLGCWVWWKGCFYTWAIHALADGKVTLKPETGWRKETWINALRYLQTLLLIGVVIIPLGYGCWFLSVKNWDVFRWCLLLFIPLVVYLLPMISLIETYYMIEDIPFLKAVRRAFAAGTRNWGRVMLVYLGSRLVASLGVLALGLQAIVLSLVMWSSSEAIALGDQVEIPFYLYIMEYAAWAIACLGVLVASWFRLMPMLYEYGSLTVFQREYEERRKKRAAMACEAIRIKEMFGGR